MTNFPLLIEFIDEAWKKELVNKGVGYYESNPKTGDTKFIVREIKSE